MAFRTWVRVLLAALGVAALTAAGQLGFAYGLGVVRFARVFDVAADARWAALLAWMTWFAVVAAIAGAAGGALAARRSGLPTATVGPRLALAGAAAVGALTVAPLSMQPARAAQLASGDPVLTAGLAAGLGALAGLFAALAMLSQRPVGWNIIVAVGGVWLVTLLSVAPSLGPTDPLPDVRLGVLDPASLSGAARARLAVLTMPALALVAGVVSGGLARLRAYPTLTAAASGAVGPGLVTLAYLAAGSGGADAYQAGPYWGALIAAGAGALGSVLASVVRMPTRSAVSRLPGATQPAPPPTHRAAPAPDPSPAGDPTPDPPHDVAPRADQDHDPRDGRALAAAGVDRSGSGLPPAANETGSAIAASVRGLVRRKRRPPGATAATRAAAQAADRGTGRGRDHPDRPVPARDEEYVDWVSGLSDAGSPAGDLSEGRRTFRDPGRHQAD